MSLYFLGGVSISLDVGSNTILEFVTISSADSGNNSVNWSLALSSTNKTNCDNRIMIFTNVYGVRCWRVYGCIDRF